MDNIYCNFERVIIYSLGSFALTVASINYGFIIMGVLFIIIALIMRLYMKSRLSLKLEEYKKKILDILKNKSYIKYYKKFKKTIDNYFKMVYTFICAK